MCSVFFLSRIVLGNPSAEDDRLYKLAVHRDFFYVGGEYVEGPSGGSLRKNQMYVERLSTDRTPRQPYPLVLIHGKAMSGANTWLNTPDGRPGWASYFLRHGYVVYIIDQPTRGRSAWLPGDFDMTTFSTNSIAQFFTGVAHYNLWPQASKHTQWPGNGTKGDAVFDSSLISTLQFLLKDTEAQFRTRDGLIALLDVIGAAVLVAHSQGRALRMVRCRCAPFIDIAMTYNPPVSSPHEISKLRIPSNETDREDCVLQAEPARTLPNLKQIPVVITVSEASYHALYDHCSVKFLQQAGVNAELLRLENIGLKGNGHLMMLEENNLEVAKAIHDWIQYQTSCGHERPAFRVL
ncbi:probable secreted lipase ARB_00047 [Physcomitrium patens]|uniref:probable secreted lipase ARB_00047 n=1 Tax=Physcomitrium patens TaxID=3218 RepID=UPI000D156855|nr:probable secreted lipase ARB_00047 [Physcomitrium patens]|eukprot:XP_024359182.1 probable secreted lipase ARB_00047 [Physcomitrella patens]